jgi:hypothetical protein
MKDADLMTDTRAERARQVHRRSEKESDRGRERSTSLGFEKAELKEGLLTSIESFIAADFLEGFFLMICCEAAAMRSLELWSLPTSTTHEVDR